MNAKTKERNLNQQLSESYTEDQAYYRFMYLTNPSRGRHTTENHIRKCYRNETLGSLLRRLDPTAFYCE